MMAPRMPRTNSLALSLTRKDEGFGRLGSPVTDKLDKSSKG